MAIVETTVAKTAIAAGRALDRKMANSASGRLAIIGSVAVGVIIIPLIFVGVMIGGIVGMAGGAAAAVSCTTSDSSDAGAVPPSNVEGIPDIALDAYVQASAKTRVDWALLAAIGWMETRHAAGHTIKPDGDVTPPITANSAGAAGPMQWTSTWKSFASDGNNDGKKDLQNYYDAALGTAKYLRSLGVFTNPHDALRGYNGSGPAAESYADQAMAKADEYRKSNPTSATGTDPSSNPAGATGTALPVKAPAHVGTLFGVHGPAWVNTGGIHTGLDFSAQTGDPVYAAKAGKVVFARYIGNYSYGRYIRILHSPGVETLYAHLSAIVVKEGQTVTTGQLIGRAGAVGNASGPHLHFELRLKGQWVDPAPWLPPIQGYAGNQYANGAVTTPDQISNGSGGSVFVVGDSITWQINQYTPQDFKDAFKNKPSGIDGERGRAIASGRTSEATGQGTRSGLSVLTSDPQAQAAGTWIVELGTNDGFDGGTGHIPDPAGTQRADLAAIGKVMKAAGPDRPVHWVNVYRPTAGPPESDPMNLALQTAAGRYSNLKVLDWASQAKAHDPQWFTMDSRLHIHPDADGNKAMATLMASQVDSFADQGDCASGGFQSLIPGGGSEAGQKAAQFALSKVGLPYTYTPVTAVNSDAYGCNGLSWAAWRSAGSQWPNMLVQDQATNRKWTQVVPKGQEQPGDLLIFYYGNNTGYGNGHQQYDHVAILINPATGEYVGAQNPSVGVAKRDHYQSDPAFRLVVRPIR